MHVAIGGAHHDPQTSVNSDEIIVHGGCLEAPSKKVVSAWISGTGSHSPTAKFNLELFT